MLEKFATRAILHDKVQVVIVFNHLHAARKEGRLRCERGVTYIVELDDVGVAHLLQDRDLAVDPLQISMVLDLLLL